MPRELPTTGWDEQSKPTTQWEIERYIGFLLTEYMGYLLQENGGRIILEGSLDNLEMESARYFRFFNNNSGQKILNNSGKAILLNGIDTSKNINTQWI